MVQKQLFSSFSVNQSWSFCRLIWAFITQKGYLILSDIKSPILTSVLSPEPTWKSDILSILQLILICPSIKKTLYIPQKEPPLCTNQELGSNKLFTEDSFYQQTQVFHHQWVRNSPISSHQVTVLQCYSVTCNVPSHTKISSNHIPVFPPSQVRTSYLILSMVIICLLSD